jgi:hypothetical protein
MLITIEINSCADCTHRCHSGGFTKRPGETDFNPYPVCHHPTTVEDVTKGKKDEELLDAYHWKHRVIADDLTIPDWCPLKAGASY